MLLIKSLWITLMMKMTAFFTVMIMKMLSLKTRVGREPLSYNEARVSTTGKGLIRMQHCLAVDPDSPIGPPVTSY